MDPETRHLVVPRTARYLTVGSAADDTSEVWFLCHGYGQLAPDLLRQGKATWHHFSAIRRRPVRPSAFSSLRRLRSVPTCSFFRRARLSHNPVTHPVR